MKKLIISILLITLWSGQAHAQAGANIDGETITSDYYFDALKWQNRTETRVAITVKEINGYYAVCAAASLANGIPRNKNMNALQAFKIMVGRKTAIRGIHWAPLYSSSANFVGRQAKCRLSKVRVGPNDELGIELAKTRF